MKIAIKTYGKALSNFMKDFYNSYKNRKKRNGYVTTNIEPSFTKNRKGEFENTFEVTFKKED